MSALWIGNFVCEDELLGRFDHSAHVQRFSAEATPLLLAATATDDDLLCSASFDDDYLGRLESLGILPPCFLSIEELSRKRNYELIQPWGWSPCIERIAKQLKVEKHPNIDVARLVNSRSFASNLARQLGCHIQGERVITNLQEFEESFQLEDYSGGFLLKTNLGQSGRGRLLRNGQTLSEQDRRWVSKQLVSHGSLVIEPKLDSILELGVQWTVPAQGPPILDGLTELTSDAAGQYHKSKVYHSSDLFPQQTLWNRIREHQLQALLEIQRQGYSGPVGIDAMIYHKERGEVGVRPLQDINARWTMGRLAICWAKKCFPDSATVFWEKSIESPHQKAVLCSPELINGTPTRFHMWCYPGAETNE